MEIRVLAVGDVVSPAGLKFLSRHLRPLRKLHGIDFCVVNGENASNLGLTRDQAEEIFTAGADVITLGNHTWGRREIVPYLDDCAFILRPANFSPQLPGRGFGVFDCKTTQIAVINLIGRCGMDYTPQNPFLEVERILPKIDTPCILVDFHAEATSEKLAMGYHLSGKISALWGTHTHVPTADCKLLPHGTGYVTDLGMTGPLHSVIGIKPELSIARFRGDLTSHYEAAPGPCGLNAVCFTLDGKTGRCLAVERVDIQETE